VAVNSTTVLNLQPAYPGDDWYLFSFDPTTTQETLVDSAGYYELNFAEGGVFVPESHTLYGIGVFEDYNSIFNVWNLQTRETLNVTFPEYAVMLNSLAWSAKNQILFGLASNSSLANSPGSIYTIDPNTYKLTLVITTIYQIQSNLVFDDEAQVVYYIGSYGPFTSPFFVLVALDLSTMQITGVPLSDQTGLTHYSLFGLQIIPSTSS